MELDLGPDLPKLSLKSLRQRIGLSQRVMAKTMGIPFRTFQDLEAGLAPTKEVYMWAAHMAALRWYAADTENAGYLSPDIRMIAERALAKFHRFNPGVGPMIVGETTTPSGG